MAGGYAVLMTLMSMDLGGAETHVAELCKALKQRGVTVYCASNGGRYARGLEAAGVEHFNVPLHNKNPLNMLRSYKMLKTIISERGVRLVHAHARIPAFLCGMLRKKLRFCLVTTAHFPFSTFFLFKMLSNWGERSLAVSDDLKQYLIERYNIPPEHITLTVNGIDTRRFASAGTGALFQEFNFNPRSKRVIFVSRLRREAAGPAHQLLACALPIYSAYQNVEFIIVGDGDDYAALEKKARAVNEQAGRELVFMTGARTDVPELLAASDMFVGVSRSALEAMTRLPVVLSGKEGYLGVFNADKLDKAVETNFCCRGSGFASDERLTADVLSLLNADAETLNALTAYGKSVVSERYSIDRMADDALAVYERARSRPPVVVICGYYGYRNSGDDYVLRSMTDGLKRAKPGIGITVLSRRPRDTAAQYGVNAVHKFNLFAIHRRLRRADALISGGGTLIQDVTSTQSLIYYLYMLRAAHKRGAGNMLFANGVGPVSRKFNRRLAKYILNKTTGLITLRESESLNELHLLGADKPRAVVTADPVFALDNTDPTAGEKLLAAAGVEKDRPYFIVAVRGWKRIPPDFETAVVRFCDYLKETYGMEAVFIAMQPNMDTKITRGVCGRMQNPGVILTVETANQMLGVTGGAAFILTMRLHTLIYAAKSGTPALALAYDPKVTNMMETLGQTTCLPLDGTNMDSLKENAAYIIENRAEISRAVSAACERERLKAADNIRLACEFTEIF